MAHCTNHPDRPAAATCPPCGRPFCDECFAPPDVWLAVDGGPAQNSRNDLTNTRSKPRY